MLTWLLARTTGMYFAERSLVMLRAGEPGTWWTGRIPFLLSFVGPLIFGLPFASLWILLAEPLLGATPGKRLLGIVVVGDRRALVVRAIAKAAPAALLMIALVIGRQEPAALALLAGLVLAIGSSAILAPGRVTLHDRLAGTSVVLEGALERNE